MRNFGTYANIIFTALFATVLCITLSLWFIFYLRTGVLLEVTLSLLPYYSPHVFDVVLFSCFFLFLFRGRWGNRAIGFLAFAICLSEVIGNAGEYAAFFNNTTLAFSNTPPYEGWIYPLKLAIFFGVTIASIILLKPQFTLKPTWAIVFPLAWLMAPLTLISFGSYQFWELIDNTLFLTSFWVIVH